MTDPWGDRVWPKMKYEGCEDSGRPYFTLFVTLPTRETHSLHLWDHKHTHTCIHLYKCTHLGDMILPYQWEQSLVCLCSDMTHLHHLRYSKVALAVVQSEVPADSAELLPNQSGDSRSFRLREIAGANSRRHVSDHWEQIRSYQDTNSSGGKRPRLEIPLT